MGILCNIHDINDNRSTSIMTDQTRWGIDMQITENKAEQHARQKIKFLEDRIATLEKSLSALNKAVGELQATEYERDINAK